MSSNFAPNQVEDIVACVKRFQGGSVRISAKGRDSVSINPSGISFDDIRSHVVEPFCAHSARGTTIVVEKAPEPWQM